LPIADRHVATALRAVQQRRRWNKCRVSKSES